LGFAEIVLYVVRRPAPTARLPWRPRRFEMTHDLPRTATGKVQRIKLREQLRRDPH